MASGAERPDLAALQELEQVLRHLEGELAGWRRRALSAESRVADLEASDDGGTLARSKALEEENQALAQRLEAARTRVTDLLERLGFLEQQGGNGEAER
jgi:predicted  nucleic acid-binding Zn-ribbon protein